MTDRSIGPVICLALATAVLALPAPALAQEPCPHHPKTDHSGHAAADGRYTTTVTKYDLPDVSLLDQDGRAVTLTEMVDRPEPVAVNFIFTTCTTICPVLTATLSGMSHQLGDDGGDLHLVSISIDPEYDRPEVLKEYAGLFDAGRPWHFLTGDYADVASALKAFDAYAEDKMNHKPLTLFRMPGDDHWVRVEGLAGASDLAAEYRELLESDHAGIHPAH